MENNEKFRLRLNLFDGVVLLLAVAVGAFLLWNAYKPAPAPSEGERTPTQTVRYTLRFQQWKAGRAELIEPGDVFTDNIRNQTLGTVISTRVTPAYALILDQQAREHVLAPLPDSEDIYITLESPCTVTADAITLESGYVLHIGETAYVRGEGYMGSGPIDSIEREGLK